MGAPSAGRARLFVAAWLPDPVLEVLDDLPRPPEAGVRYTRRDQWHVTLRFLGSCNVDEATAALDRIDADRAVAELGPAIAPLGRSVVVVPVSGLDAIAEATVRATAELGEPPDPRSFTGHVTIARLRNRSVSPVTGTPVHARFTVDRIHLVRSDLRSDGAAYDTLASRPLR